MLPVNISICLLSDTASYPQASESSYLACSRGNRPDVCLAGAWYMSYHFPSPSISCQDEALMLGQLLSDIWPSLLSYVSSICTEIDRHLTKFAVICQHYMHSQKYMHSRLHLRNLQFVNKKHYTHSIMHSQHYVSNQHYIYSLHFISSRLCKHSRRLVRTQHWTIKCHVSFPWNVIMLLVSIYGFFKCQI